MNGTSGGGSLRMAAAIDRRSGGEREVEPRAAIRLSFRPDASPMPPDDALNGRQPDAGSLELFARMQTLKDAEQLQA